MNPILIWLFALLQASGVPTGPTCAIVLGDADACEEPAPPPPETEGPFDLKPQRISNGF